MEAKHSVNVNAIQDRDFAPPHNSHDENYVCCRRGGRKWERVLTNFPLKPPFTSISHVMKVYIEPMPRNDFNQLCLTPEAIKN